MSRPPKLLLGLHLDRHGEAAARGEIPASAAATPLLSPWQMMQVASAVPPRHRYDDWELLFDSRDDGMCLSALYHHRRARARARASDAPRSPRGERSL